uniref:Transcription factor AP-1 n=1 Tax=Pinctada fucata TaxID=50426 RepID=A0A0H4LHR1_PINFU|nr:transcription factor AP-1 [Pinctada fucata]
MEAVDRTFYPDEPQDLKIENNQVNQLKRKMTLDFNSGGKTKQQKVAQMLASPDLNMLKLASPELEKMIIQANGFVTTTPTPTQFIFPKYVTEEQEQYARGFVEALAEIHGKQQVLPVPQGAIPPPQQKPVALTRPRDDSSDDDSNSSFHHSSDPVVSLATTTTLPGGLVTINPAVSLFQSAAMNRTLAQNSLTSLTNVRTSQVKEEPQTVPCVNSNTPPLSPIDMDNQEKIKLERKRARNRVAARKCRTRKLERIARLEERVAELKGQNSDLASTASNLRDQVCKLKQQIIEHVNSGCNIMLSTNIQLC